MWPSSNERLIVAFSMRADGGSLSVWPLLLGCSKGRESMSSDREREGGCCCHRETHRSSPCHRLISGLISCLSHVCNWIAPIHHQHRDIFPFSFLFSKKEKKKRDFLARSFIRSFSIVWTPLQPLSHLQHTSGHTLVLPFHSFCIIVSFFFFFFFF